MSCVDNANTGVKRMARHHEMDCRPIDALQALSFAALLVLQRYYQSKLNACTIDVTPALQLLGAVKVTSVYWMLCLAQSCWVIMLVAPSQSFSDTV